MKFLAFLTVVSASVLLSAAQAVEIGAIEIFSGACEPSGALALRGGGLDGGFLIANDEDNILRLYVPGTAKPIPATGADLNGPLGLDPADEDDKVDFEAAATIGDRNFLIGSHSRSNKGRRRLSRETFLSVSIAGPSDNPQLSVSKPATLIEALAKVDAIKKSIALDDVKHEQLAAEAMGSTSKALHRVSMARLPS